ncbi:MAG: hypothetical protein KHZ62_02180 [Clostridiales bacterium]|nr:hypothetical protein [Clostridiales bacterium]
MKLKEYIPHAVKGFQEIESLLEAADLEKDNLWTGSYLPLTESFVELCGEEGLQRMEAIFSLKAEGTMQERKFALLARMMEVLPFTERRLRQTLDGLCGQENYRLEVDEVEETLSVGLAIVSKENAAAVQKLLDRMTPLCLGINVYLIYRRWNEVKDMIWNEAKKGSWTNLREN